MNVRAAQVLRGALAASGMTHAELAAAVGTSRPRVTSYVSGATNPNADLWLEMLLELGVMDWHEGSLTADATVEKINSAATTAEKFRWLLEGRDHLRSAGPLEALANWGRVDVGSHDARWGVFLAALVALEFERKGIPAPRWTTVDPVSPEWHPDPRSRDAGELDGELLSRAGIAVRPKDLVTM
ncbi:MAG: helix-turn-helix transcriptional regulator [Phycicoccus sp.]|nr:helix-turn-helix transcriptional regulator [Phycicoccus sp.]